MIERPIANQSIKAHFLIRKLRFDVLEGVQTIKGLCIYIEDRYWTSFQGCVMWLEHGYGSYPSLLLI